VAMRTGIFLALIVLEEALQLLDSLIHFLDDTFEMLLVVGQFVSFANGLIFEEGKVL